MLTTAPRARVGILEPVPSGATHGVAPGTRGRDLPEAGLPIPARDGIEELIRTWTRAGVNLAGLAAGNDRAGCTTVQLARCARSVRPAGAQAINAQYPAPTRLRTLRPAAG